ncbi:MAG: glycosyltransferase family 4 protein [candidate division KSB1 bacterium]|nr:glycosyltransferase family 4 protein [candidate division KSB1 bacterium]MDZ7368496.1 glycosyltransferase family 4 protein [candidate division KSB1 bacterium]MDZ7406222.1 glycosyltransferase family 4 protein [candidate division KSB1 bacterium]
MIRMAYIVSRFPKLSETFVFREVNELRRQGAEVLCFSIHRPMQEPLPPDAEHFLKETTYLWPPHPAQFFAGMLKFATTRPAEFFDALKLFWQRAPRGFSGKKRFVLHFLEGVYLAHLCKQRGVEYIHAHFANGPSSVAMAASAVSGIPFGFTSHAQDIYSDPLMLEVKIAAAQLPLTISSCNRDYIIENFPVENAAKLRVQRVAVDLAHFRPRHSTETREESPLILAIGRLVPKKGFIHLIRACEILALRGINFRCWIVGEGPERAALQAAIAAGNLQDKVNLLGAQTEVKKFLQRADLFVMPCVLDSGGDRDGIPTTLMEAMAMQVPVISTNLSGIPELVQHEQTGLLVPPANHEALAQAICRLIVDEKLRQELAAEGRRHIEIYHDLAANTEKLLQNILRQVAGNEDGRNSSETDLFDSASLSGRVSAWRRKVFAGTLTLQFA